MRRRVLELGPQPAHRAGFLFDGPLQVERHQPDQQLVLAACAFPSVSGQHGGVEVIVQVFEHADLALFVSAVGWRVVCEVLCVARQKSTSFGGKAKSIDHLHAAWRIGQVAAVALVADVLLQPWHATQTKRSGFFGRGDETSTKELYATIAEVFVRLERLHVGDVHANGQICTDDSDFSGQRHIHFAMLAGMFRGNAQQGAQLATAVAWSGSLISFTPAPLRDEGPVFWLCA